MSPISYSLLRKNLKDTMDQVCNNREPIVVTRQGSESVVMIALDEYESMVETLYLLRSPANAARLNEAIQRADSARGVEFQLP